MRGALLRMRTLRSVIIVAIVAIILAYSLGAVYGQVMMPNGQAEPQDENEPFQEPSTPHDDRPEPRFPEDIDDTSSDRDLPGLEETVMVTTEGIQIVTNPDHVLVLVNKERNLPPDYIPNDLVAAEVPFPFEGNDPRKLMQREAAEALQQLVAGALEDSLEIYGLSGYRSYDTQKQIFAYNVQRRGEEQANQFSARPGQSEHQTGLAMDVTSRRVDFGLTQAFGETAEGHWLEEHAHEFGFIIRYPRGKEQITGYQYEPWHLRYVGIEHANAIQASGLTLEEYLEQK